ncbi:MAG: MGMT family protein [Clostridiaceae bacterium]|nr:MGMT family protein [Clostridiaceae bacterium]
MDRHKRGGVKYMGFFKRVHEVVSFIPAGRVMSYRDIAELLDDPKKARFVGFAMKLCPSDYPWHRVVKNDGRVVTGALQVMILKKEGVPFVIDGYVDMEKCKIYPAEMQLMMGSHGCN